MPKILTVDDSRAVRTIVTRHAAQMGFEVDEAEDGEQGLLKMEDERFDLVVLDITMPVLDGPGMLAKLRERGDTTPVLMLTSESKRSIIAAVMKLGIADYILKPFKPEELSAKILKALNLDRPPGPEAAHAAAPEPVATPAAMAAAAAAREPARPDNVGKQFCDILVVDDVENVHKRLRTMIPEHLSIAAALTASAALTICRERVFRAILVDNEIPDTDSASLMRQLRLLQPHAGVLMLALRSTNDLQAEARDSGFDGVIFKPFKEEGIEDFLLRFFDSQEVVVKADNVLRIAAFKGRDTRLPGYFLQVAAMAARSVEEIADACYADVILDLTNVPPVAEKTARLVLDLDERAKKVGVELRLVGSSDVVKALSQYSETAALSLFKTVAEAQGARA